jgi:DNA-binding transcriptional regulator YiaG
MAESTVQLMSRPTGGDLVKEAKTSTTRTDVAVLHRNFTSLADEVGVLAQDTFEGAARSRELLVSEQTTALQGRQVRWLVGELANLGLSWTDIARVVGVSVPALRKWRQGGAASPDNRKGAARLLAVLNHIAKTYLHIEDVAGWAETPVWENPPTTPLDIIASGHEAELLDYMDARLELTQLLDAHDPAWRSRVSVFEVVQAADGHMSIQPRV